MQLAQSGTFIGPEEMTEYVNFVDAKFFDYYKRGEMKIVPRKLEKDECILLFVNQNIAQVNANYGNPVCAETTVGVKLHYTVSGPDGSGFHIHRTNLYYPPVFLDFLFNEGLGTSGVRDYICDDVMGKNCMDTFTLNDITSESCKEKYDALPVTSEYGYLDEHTKGCRILHSAFAEINAKHCPHLSFLPQKDYKGRFLCQESNRTKAEDLFTNGELAIIKKQAVEWGQDKYKLFKNCKYIAPIVDGY